LVVQEIPLSCSLVKTLEVVIPTLHVDTRVHWGLHLGYERMLPVEL